MINTISVLLVALLLAGAQAKPDQGLPPKQPDNPGKPTDPGKPPITPPGQPAPGRPAVPPGQEGKPPNPNGPHPPESKPPLTHPDPKDVPADAPIVQPVQPPVPLPVGVTAPAPQTQLPSNTPVPQQAPSETAPTGTAAPVLPEVMQLRIDNHALRLRVAQMEQQINQLMLSQERTTLDLDIMRSNPGWQMDWQTGQLRRVSEIGTPPPTTAPPTATPPRPNQ